MPVDLLESKSPETEPSDFNEFFMPSPSFTIRRLAFVAAGFLVLSGASSAQLAVTGIVRPVEEVVLKSEVSGVVARIVAVEGERVRQGQVLIELRDDHQKTSLELSRAGLEKARATVEETRVLLESAEKELHRIEIAGDALPRQELERVGDQVLRLRANLNAQVAEAARAEQEVKLREWDLRDTQLAAPFDGTVTEIFVHRGDSISPIDPPVLQLVALDELYAELLLPSSYVPRVSLRQSVQIRIEGEWMGRTGQLEGQITYINPTIDAASRTFKVKVRVPASGGLVRPGMLVEEIFGP